MEWPKPGGRGREFTGTMLDLINGMNLRICHGAVDGTLTLSSCLVLLFLPLWQKYPYFLLLAGSISKRRVCLPRNPALDLPNSTVTFSLQHFD